MTVPSIKIDGYLPWTVLFLLGGVGPISGPVQLSFGSLWIGRDRSHHGHDITGNLCDFQGLQALFPGDHPLAVPASLGNRVEDILDVPAQDPIIIGKVGTYPASAIRHMADDTICRVDRLPGRQVRSLRE